MMQIFIELCIIATGVAFFFALAATFGIPRSERSTPTAIAAEEVLPERSTNHIYRFSRDEIRDVMERAWAP